MEMCAHPQRGESLSSYRSRRRARVRLRPGAVIAPWEPVLLESAFPDLKEPARASRRAFSCPVLQCHPERTVGAPKVPAMIVPKNGSLPNLLSRLVASPGPANMNRYDGHGLAPPRATLDGGGIIRFPWNMPTRILFFTTRSCRFAAFLSRTRKSQVRHP